MLSYPINELERLTGIKAHTIRIWEKRYGLIAPERSETNRRLYNNDQVRKLLNVNTLLSKGLKISKIASLSEAELYRKIEEGIEDGPPTSVITSAYINDLVKTMTTFDEAGFEKIFAAALTRFGMYGTITEVVYPFLNKVGIMWSVEKTAPDQEHFASSIVRRKLMAAIDGILPPTNKKKFLLYLPEDEWHEIGLLLANYIIRSHGYDSLFLGQNVPMENLLRVSSMLEPDFLFTFFITTRPVEEIERHIHQVIVSAPNSCLLLAGNGELFQQIKSLPGQVSYLQDVAALVAFLNKPEC